MKQTFTCTMYCAHVSMYVVSTYISSILGPPSTMHRPRSVRKGLMLEHSCEVEAPPPPSRPQNGTSTRRLLTPSVFEKMEVSC